MIDIVRQVKQVRPSRIIGLTDSIQVSRATAYLTLLAIAGVILAALMRLDPGSFVSELIVIPLAMAALWVYSKRTGRDVSQIAIYAMFSFLFVGSLHIIHATSFSIDFSTDALQPFFDWFNMIFDALLPIALLGAGLTAGAVFVFVVAGMLVSAFTRLLGRGRIA